MGEGKEEDWERGKGEGVSKDEKRKGAANGLTRPLKMFDGLERVVDFKIVQKYTGLSKGCRKN